MDTSVRTQDSSPLGISTIGEELTIAGDVTSKGELHIDGHVQGDVYCVALVLGENAQLEGNVVAEDVTVRGHLTGSVSALTVTLEANSRVEGNLFHTSLPLNRVHILKASHTPLRIRYSSGPKVLAVEPPLDEWHIEQACEKLGVADKFEAIMKVSSPRPELR